jgi:molybdopterin-guanine dinucleotide biosynthesis protein A
MGGHAKALLPFGENTLIQHQVDVMRQICEEIIVVTNEPRPLLAYVDRSVRVITDYVSGLGPLGGMHAGLSLARHPKAWIVGCDMPFLSPQAAKLMLERAKGVDAVLPADVTGPYPLHGVYDRSCVRVISELVEKGERSLFRMLSLIDWISLTEPECGQLGLPFDFVFEINTPEDHSKAREKWAAKQRNSSLLL